MKITLESTTEIVDLNGALCRVWLGSTAGGVSVTAFIARVAVPHDADGSEELRGLIETEPPRMVLG